MHFSLLQLAKALAAFNAETKKIIPFSQTFFNREYLFFVVRFLREIRYTAFYQPTMKYLHILFRNAPLFGELLLCGVSACKIHILPQTLHGARGGLYCGVVVGKQLRKVWQATVGHLDVGFSLGKLRVVPLYDA